MSSNNRKLIDLRSDTVTRPTPQMRAAMANAEVGDDVYGEDPTVNLLEAEAARVFGKEAALFVPTGTMGNTIAAKLHTTHGEEIVCEAHSHLIDWELSMVAWFAGCIPRAVTTSNGLLDWPRIHGALRRKGPHNAPTSLVWLENTHNMAGGTVYPLAQMQEIGIQAREHGLKVHIDGARIFNAAAALGLPVAELAAPADTVMFCLSKGLGAPVGSLLVGSTEDIAQGRLYRKRLGGGMRQAGILAAAGLLALRDGPLQLAVDHENAAFLAERIAALPGIQFDPATVQTNILIFDISPWKIDTAELSRQLKDHGILANGIDARRLRLLTHRDVTRQDCEIAADTLGEIAVRQMQQEPILSI